MSDCNACAVPLTDENCQMWDLYGAFDDPVCDRCFLLGEAAANWTRADVLNGAPIGTTARKVVELYESDRHE